MSQIKNWVFTWNNPDTPVDFSEHEGVKYAVYQKEVGENGTPHYQGYVELTRSQRLSFVRKILPKAHWEKRRATAPQARAYAMKESTRVEGPWEYGTFDAPEQGKRNDLLLVKEAIDNGTPYKDLVDQYFVAYAKYDRFLTKYQHDIRVPPRNHKPNVTVLIGPPGTGKSKYILDNYPTAYWKAKNKWWDGYNANPHVALDEYYGWLPFDEFFRLLDRYPLLVETKGGSVQFVATDILITSNRCLDKWYKRVPDIRALYRRVDKVIWYTSLGEYTEHTDIEAFVDAYNNQNSEPETQTIRPPSDIYD